MLELFIDLNIKNIVDETPVPIIKELKRQDIMKIIEVKAREYEVSEKLIEDIIQCESGFNPKSQSKHKYTFTDEKNGIFKGEREQSFGLVQIHTAVHKNITKEQAKDPHFAIDFLAKNLAKGKGKMWTCFSKIKMK